MKPYKDKDEFVRIMSELWERISKTPEIVHAVAGVKLIAKFHYTDYDTDLYIDISGDTPRYYWDPADKVAADVEMILTSDTGHAFWMEDLNVPLAIAGRKIIAKGSLQKALKLLPALKPSFAMYPPVLKDMGRADLLIKKPEGKRKKSRLASLFKGIKKRQYNLDVIPAFPMSLSKEKTKLTVPEKPKAAPKVADIELFRMMCRIRSFEEHLAAAFRKGELPTEAIHLSTGQEAVAAGVCMNLRDTDYLNTTHRGHGHMEGDPQLYRTEEELEKYKEQDPIARMSQAMTGSGKTAEEQINKIKQEVEQELSEAVAFAKSSPLPESSALMTHVYAPDDPSLFQGEVPVVNEQRETRQVSVSQAVNEAVAEEMARDEKIFLWGEDVTLGGYFNVTECLIDRFGKNRVIDTPISEYGIIGGAVGAAMTGMRPIAEILFSDFLTCCMDPILNQAAKLRYMTGGQAKVPLTVRSPLGAGIGMAAQHSQSMEKFFFGVPGLIVVAPSDAYTAKGLLKAAVRSDNPVLFFEHKLLYANAGKIPMEDYILPLGKARVALEGGDVTIVSHLLGLTTALDAAKLLASSGIHTEVIDLMTLYPMDTKSVLASVAKTGYLVTVEEGTTTGNIGAEVIARVATAGFDLLKAAPVRIAALECPIPYASNLENAMLPKPELIAEKVETLLRA